MREMMWIFAVIILTVCETWSLDEVVRNSSFNLGSDVNLTCGDKLWSELMFVIWRIEIKNKSCTIGHIDDGQSKDTCNDGKSLQNTSRAEPYLHIPNFSSNDVGIYDCETVYSGGNDAYVINVAIIVPPSISAWLEWKGNKMVAVCKAERGTPAANINWSHKENSSSLKTWHDSDGFFTVESRLELPENMDTKNLSCSIRHPYWEGERTLVPKPTKVVRNSSFNLGSDVNLTCSDKPWSELMFVIWRIEITYKSCTIGHTNDGQSKDTCNDGKSLRNTSRAEPYLHIPNFSSNDVGIYDCETHYWGGNDAYMINVAIIVPPGISACLEWKGNKMVAVCKAERGTPAANINWSHKENSSSLKTWHDSDGFFTVESRLELPENMDTKNLSCSIRHPYWEGERTLVPKPTKVVRNSSFNLGSDVNLTCSDKPWSELMFVIWRIEITYKSCTIGHTNDGQSKDTCNDGKSLRNTSRAEPYLHIPNFSSNDVGIYDCETHYWGGNDAYMINVAIIVPPGISACLEWKGNKMVAVCKAERGTPAANINWSHKENSSSLKTWHDSDGFFTVESRLELPENMDTKNLSCSIRHPYWEGERTLVPKPTKGLDFTLMCIRIVVIITAVLAGVLFFAEKKTNMLRCCRQANTSSSESLPTEDVEEVELHASYVQHVNSVHHS